MSNTRDRTKKEMSIDALAKLYLDPEILCAIDEVDIEEPAEQESESGESQSQMRLLATNRGIKFIISGYVRFRENKPVGITLISVLFIVGSVVYAQAETLVRFFTTYVK